MPNYDYIERRRHPRHKVLKTKIYPQETTDVIDVVIQEMSVAGGSLRLQTSIFPTDLVSYLLRKICCIPLAFAGSKEGWLGLSSPAWRSRQICPDGSTRIGLLRREETARTVLTCDGARFSSESRAIDTLA